MSPSTHFIGIGGTGLSAIARVLMERGESVSGSDRDNSSLAEALSKEGAKISIGHAEANVNGATRVIRSSAISDDNVEVLAAQANGIPVLKRSEILGDLLADHQVIAIAGSHGKTTTTAMLAWILTALDQMPGYIIGSIAQNLTSNASAGNGNYFVIEADEYDHMFLGLNPALALITNVEYDHPDFFASEEDFHSAFRQFADRIQPNGQLLICADNPGALEIQEFALTQGIALSSYAIENKDADYLPKNLKQLPDAGFSFEMTLEGDPLAKVHLQVPGLHNAENALGALASAHLLGLPLDKAALALSEFQGTGRRFEIRGEAAGVLLIDDYAHHPTEIRAVLAAARSRYPDRRIVTVWQPHTFSRTLTLQTDFSAAFKDTHILFVTDVYAAREEKPSGFDIAEIVKGIQHPSAHHAGDSSKTEAALLSEIKSGDVLLLLSAGDAIELSAALYQKLQDRE